jgi:hypothetical protein
MDNPEVVDAATARWLNNKTWIAIIVFLIIAVWNMANLVFGLPELRKIVDRHQIYFEKHDELIFQQAKMLEVMKIELKYTQQDQRDLKKSFDNLLDELKKLKLVSSDIVSDREEKVN